MIRTHEAIAHAKLNLTLRVVGKRADGLHLLDSLTVFTDFGDRVRVTTHQQRDYIEVFGPFASGIDGDNIVSKALDRYRSLTETPGGLAIEIEKNIPVAAGLGGGSCDVGAVLRILQELVQKPLSDRALTTLAMSIGADVPVCFSAQPARMRGIGEVLSPIGLVPPCPLVLVNPGVPVSAGRVFQAFRGPFSGPIELPANLSNEASLLGHIGAEPHNDLIATAATLAPAVSDVLTFLSGFPEVKSAGMSGSGATCFGVFSAVDNGKISSVVECARERGWWATTTKLRQ